MATAGQFSWPSMGSCHGAHGQIHESLDNRAQTLKRRSLAQALQAGCGGHRSRSPSRGDDGSLLPDQLRGRQRWTWTGTIPAPDERLLAELRERQATPAGRPNCTNASASSRRERHRLPGPGGRVPLTAGDRESVALYRQRHAHPRQHCPCWRRPRGWVRAPDDERRRRRHRRLHARWGRVTAPPRGGRTTPLGPINANAKCSSASTG